MDTQPSRQRLTPSVLLSIVAPALSILLLGSLACAVQDDIGDADGVENFLPNDPQVTVLDPYAWNDGLAVIYGTQIPLLIKHDACPGELTLRANTTALQTWETNTRDQFEITVDLSDVVPATDLATQVTFHVAHTCRNTIEPEPLRAQSEAHWIVPTSAQVPSTTSNLTVHETGLYGWDLGRFYTATTRNGIVEEVERVNHMFVNGNPIINLVGSVLYVVGSPGNIYALSQDPLELLWSGSNDDVSVLAAQIAPQSPESPERVFVVFRYNSNDLLGVGELSPEDGAMLWSVELNARTLLAGPKLTKDGTTLQVVVHERAGELFELSEATITLPSPNTTEAEVALESLRLSSMEPSARLVHYTDDGAQLLLPALDNTNGALVLALARDDTRSSWQLPAKDLHTLGQVNPQTLWVSAADTLRLLNRDGEIEQAITFDGEIIGVQADPEGLRGFMVMFINENGATRWSWVSSELELLLTVPANSVAIWEPGRAPIFIRDNYAASGQSNDFTMLRLPEGPLANP